MDKEELKIIMTGASSLAEANIFGGFKLFLQMIKDNDYLNRLSKEELLSLTIAWLEQTITSIESRVNK